jgi:hypothetical protein
MMIRSRPESCLSDFALDRRFGNELDAEEEDAARAHVAGCERCARRWEALRAGQEAFASEAPVLDLGAHARAHGRRSWWLAVGGGLLATAAAAALVLHPHRDDPGTRPKGHGSRFGFYVAHAGSVRLGAAGGRVEPGDALRFTYEGREARYVAVLSVDGAKRVTTYYPDSGVAARREPGAPAALPLSTVLDDTLGEETIYGIACPAPFDVEALRVELERAPQRAPEPAGCDVDVVTLVKEAPGRR